jgi:uncharacterized membrane protein YdbT with pleckstrin-like domain
MLEKDVLYFSRLHWILFFWPILLACFAIFIGANFTQLGEVSLLFFVVASIWVLMTWITYHFSSITIKKKQVILRTGMLVRQTVDIPLSKIETIDIRQSILGSILGYGSLIITGTGGTRHIVNFLDNPLTCRRYIEQLLHD